MLGFEARGLPYLFKLRHTSKVKDLVVRMMRRGEAWQDCGDGWRALESSIRPHPKTPAPKAGGIPPPPAGWHKPLLDLRSHCAFTRTNSLPLAAAAASVTPTVWTSPLVEVTVWPALALVSSVQFTRLVEVHTV